MLDESGKKKLRKLWYKRLGISFGLIVGLGFSLATGQQTYHRLQQIQKLEQLRKGNVVLFQRELEEFLRKEIKRKQLREVIVRDESVRIVFTDKTTYDFELPITVFGTSQSEKLRKLKKDIQLTVAFLVLSLFGFIIMLFLLLKQNSQISLTFAGQLICFIPEECVAELEALSQQLKSRNSSDLLVNMIIFASFIELIFALYIQINVENLWLPSQKNKKK